MAARIVVLGGGVGGTLVANRLARRADVEVAVVDNHGRHLYQPALLYVPFDRAPELERDEATLLRRNVTLRVGRATGLDPDARRVLLEDGPVDYDWLVLATGSRSYHDGVPGLREHSCHFHCPKAAASLRDRLRGFAGGRVVIGVASLPYKCPPSVIEFALLFDEWLRERGIRDRTEIAYTYPIDGVFTKPEVSAVARRWLEERGIRVETSFVPASVEPKAIASTDGRRLDFDLLVMVPPHAAAPYLRGPAVAGPLGWVKADRYTLRVRERLYALGDTADLPVPKSGAAAHFQSEVVARNVADEIDGRAPSARYDGRVMCFLEGSRSKAALIAFDYERPPKPPRLSWFGHLRKALLNRFYWRIVSR
jgi:sulfide:quinone oxidoreductase